MDTECNRNQASKSYETTKQNACNIANIPNPHAPQFRPASTAYETWLNINIAKTMCEVLSCVKHSTFWLFDEVVNISGVVSAFGFVAVDVIHLSGNSHPIPPIRSAKVADRISESTARVAFVSHCPLSNGRTSDGKRLIRINALRIVIFPQANPNWMWVLSVVLSGCSAVCVIILLLSSLLWWLHPVIYRITLQNSSTPR